MFRKDSLTNDYLMTIVLLVALSTTTYNYIVAIDTEDAVLFCNITRNASIQNVVWRRDNVNATNLSNPLNILDNYLELGRDRALVCTDMLDGGRLLTTVLFVQGKLNTMDISSVVLFPVFP